MLSEQLMARGIRDRRVLEAMGRVPREQFMSPELEADAYSDRALPIECEQTISQPFMVALMTEALGLSGTERVLEIGTGSGYQAAVLAELAQSVVTVERHPELSATAAARLARLGYGNVHLVVGDGTQGWPEEAPYDRVIVTAATRRCPQPLFDQLAEGGLLVIPLGDDEGQVLHRIRKSHGQPTSQALTGCRFVPLIADDETAN